MILGKVVPAQGKPDLAEKAERAFRRARERREEEIRREQREADAATVRAAGCACRALWTAMDADECESSFDGEIHTGFDSKERTYGDVVRHDSRCPYALAAILEGKRA